MICVVPGTINLTLNFFVWQEWPEGNIPYYLNHHISFIGNGVKLYPDPQTHLELVEELYPLLRCHS